VLAALDRAMLPELKAAAEMPPGLTFVDQLVLQRGDRTIEIRWLGRGNTRGDTVVVLPKERIAATGDLLVHPVPFGILSYYEEWPVTLEQLDALPVDVLFPGHGPVLHDRAYLRQVQGLLRALVDSRQGGGGRGRDARGDAATGHARGLEDDAGRRRSNQAAGVRQLFRSTRRRANLASASRGAGQITPTPELRHWNSDPGTPTPKAPTPEPRHQHLDR
jgi:glyoxylase-like metal-dependent hydrolase (beta-lactamase superfamily II)